MIDTIPKGTEELSKHLGISKYPEKFHLIN